LVVLFFFFLVVFCVVVCSLWLLVRPRLVHD
jgi:heme/copper-type cytochrome/quinol oxidase subunit 4